MSPLLSVDLNPLLELFRTQCGNGSEGFFKIKVGGYCCCCRHRFVGNVTKLLLTLWGLTISKLSSGLDGTLGLEKLAKDGEDCGGISCSSSEC